MNKDWLQYCATEEQLKAFSDTGYLIVENALSPEMVEKLTVAIDRIDAKEREKLSLGPDGLVQKFRTVVEDDIFLELLDHPNVFPLLWDILGWNIQLYISHMIVYPPESKKIENDNSISGGLWHIDGGRPVVEIERPYPKISLKVSYWLTDVSEPDRGAMKLLPGSHKLNRKPTEKELDGAIDLLVKPGSAVLFDQRLWHRRGWNYSDITRKVLFMGYSYRWLRGFDYNQMSPEILAKCDPIRRQLLGDGVDIKGWWQPTDKDVPLKTWIAENRGEQYVL